MGLRCDCCRLDSRLVAPLLLYIGLALPTNGFAQTRELTIRSQTRLVMVPVLVQDKDGQHVGGLKAEDFVVQEEGRAQKIAVFEEVKPEEGLVQRPAAEVQEFTNQVAAQTTRRLTIIALDAGSSGVADQRRARDAMLRYLAATAKSDAPMALVFFSRAGIRVIHDFSTDPERLRAALVRLEPTISGKDSGPAPDHLKLVPFGAPTDGSVLTSATSKFTMNTSDALGELFKFSRDPDGIYKQFDRDTGISSTLENFANVAHGFAGIPGRKELIWITAAFPFSITNPDESDSRDFSVAYKRTFQLLNDANIAVYPVDIRGLLVQVFGDISVCTTCGRSLSSGMQNAELIANPNVGITESTANIATLESFASMTGGKAFYNRNDIDKSMQAANRDAAGYYMLGYYRISAPAKAEWRKLKVKSIRDGTKVRARSGYFALPDAESVGDAKTELQQAALSQVQYTALPVMVKIQGITENGANKVVKARISVPPNTVTIDGSQGNRVLVDFVGLARDIKGDMKGSFSQTFRGNLKPEDVSRFDAAGLNYGNQFELPSGEYSLKFVVRDGVSGRIGSVIVPISVQ
jgi:VWFA-related protein